MKNLKITFLTIITAFMAFTCSSDDDSSSSQTTNAELIIGTWKLTSASSNGAADTLTECSLLDTLTFNETTVIFNYSITEEEPCNSESETSPYSINDNTITLTNSLGSIVTNEVASLNSTTLTLRYDQGTDTEPFVYLEIYTRQ